MLPTSFSVYALSSSAIGIGVERAQRAWPARSSSSSGCSMYAGSNSASFAHCRFAVPGVHAPLTSRRSGGVGADRVAHRARQRDVATPRRTPIFSLNVVKPRVAEAARFVGDLRRDRSTKRYAAIAIARAPHAAPQPVQRLRRTPCRTRPTSPSRRRTSPSPRRACDGSSRARARADRATPPGRPCLPIATGITTRSSTAGIASSRQMRFAPADDPARGAQLDDRRA